MKIGVFGGTFDPIHNGHIAIGMRAKEEYGLDALWFMPAGDPYFKSGKPGKKLTPPELRLAMTKACVDELNNAYLKSIRKVQRSDGGLLTEENIEAGGSAAGLSCLPFFCCDYEVRQSGRTFTSRTMTAFSEAYPDDRFYFIIGADSLYQLEKWYEPEKLFAHAVILCAGRSGERDRLHKEMKRLNETYRHAGCDIREIHTEDIDISSTMIRSLRKEGKDISGVLPASVLHIIEEKGLYL